MADQSPNDDPDGRTDEDDEWNPRLPSDVLADTFVRAENGRVITFNVLLFAVVAIGFGVPPVLYNIFVGFGGTFGMESEIESLHIVVDAIATAILLAPVVATFTGVLTGFQFDQSPSAVGILGAIGAVTGFVVFCLLLVVLGALSGMPSNPLLSALAEDPAFPVMMIIGVALAAFGGAATAGMFTRQ
ncbi:hypothetical protein C482_08451 [Natrialba chahannaoensis JCM 10990]|uniref:Uncharacterized protein n=1 Tax=Natrialba chahannaoensis JCM 10990 TaxID=1227492 RepID=M0ASB3_9EURY|nr:hypothetical protein [Natrialba chahannaoensis]ELZ01212.1 hypothetical protein C482_08451 [Natrialba chahannaoensis JCM 10990]